MTDRTCRAEFRIHSEVTDAHGVADREILDFRADGYVRSGQDGAVVFHYHEDAGGQRTRCTVTVFEDGVVTVLREGAAEVRFVFEPGARYETVYKAAGYSFDAEVETEETKFERTETGGSLAIRYRMKIGGVSRKYDFSLACFAV